MKLVLLCLSLASSALLFACTTDSADSNGSGSGGASNPPPPSNSGLPADSTSPEDPPQESDPDIDSEATSFFFSYDESGSTAARDLALFAIAEGRRTVDTENTSLTRRR